MNKNVYLNQGLAEHLIPKEKRIKKKSKLEKLFKTQSLQFKLKLAKNENEALK